MNLDYLFNSQTKTITFSAGILAISYFLSAILGLIREGLLVGKFGASPELDVYFAAFRIPDFVYNILILGGLMVAFLPLFSEYFSRNKKEAWEMTNQVLNAVLFLLIFSSLILFILTPWLIKLIFPGFNPDQEKLAIPLIRLLFLSPIFLGVSNLLSGILQYFNRFFVYGLTPIFYNLGIIFGILILAPKFGIFGVGMGVILGAFLHLVIQIPSAINCGFSYKFLFDFKSPALKRIFNLMIPRVFGIAAQQINLIFITGLASTLFPGAITIFNFSNNLQSLPVGLIGVPFAVASFPALARTWAENKRGEFFKNFNLALRQILFLIIPISLSIFIFKTPIVKLIVEVGSLILEMSKFSGPQINLASACLGIFSLSLFAQSLIPLLVRVFFAWQDTKTPTLITIPTVLSNVILAFSLTHFLTFSNLFSNFIKNSFNLAEIDNISVVGLPLAFSISAIFQFLLLVFFSKRKLTIIGKKLNLK